MPKLKTIKSLLIDTSGGPQRPGKEVVLALKSAGTIFATVRWCRSGTIGLKFDKTFDVGKLVRLAAGRAQGRIGFEEIEATQAQLRESIERSHELSGKAQRLLDKHRQDLGRRD